MTRQGIHRREDMAKRTAAYRAAKVARFVRAVRHLLEELSFLRLRDPAISSAVLLTKVELDDVAVIYGVKEE